ncbi:Collectin-12 [Desmophyllum pertusum]|uniref:Collectin-12 n=1 Tax=Desmophyllum pertusum TaxID=174260 RepID=A0A9X0CQA4_9CNID|nr:Collectin-12 [Desmophyllum pertusum]
MIPRYVTKGSFQTVCDDKSGYHHILLSPDTDENEFIRSKCLVGNNVDYCIGLTDEDQENKWKWSDGSNLGNYANWGNGPSYPQPNGKDNENCVGIRNGTFAGTDLIVFSTMAR